MEITKAVIMARGLGTRMRQANQEATLTADQATIAGSGVKGMMPVGRPFLDYVLGALADAGYREICLVIGPEHEVLRDYLTSMNPRRLAISHAIQQEPRGTADAVLAAERFTTAGEFLLLNSDNYYPVTALRALGTLDGPGLAAFSSRALIEESGIPAGRVGSFPQVLTNRDNWLTGLKPGDSLPNDAWISMNCWRLGPRIFEACRRIAPSPRNELELPDAVEQSIAMGERYRVVRSEGTVLDLSTRADIGRVTAQLQSIKVEL